MVVFLDTSAIYALADRDDPNHEDALRRFREVLEAGESILVHNYVTIESAALLHRRLGRDAAVRFLEDSQTFQIRWVDQGLHRRAVERYKRRKGQVSLVDEVSFLVMRDAGIERFIAYDDDFLTEGFRPYSSM